MKTETLTIDFKPKANGQKVVVELDVVRFERLAANLGLFNSDFLASLERAERQIAQDKVKQLFSLKHLRRRS